MVLRDHLDLPLHFKEKLVLWTGNNFSKVTEQVSWVSSLGLTSESVCLAIMLSGKIQLNSILKE